MMPTRPATAVIALFCCLLLVTFVFAADVASRRAEQEKRISLLRDTVGHLALSDLALTSEARYTRHLTVSDKVVVSMDHPGGLDHFPSTMFFTPGQ